MNALAPRATVVPFRTPPTTIEALMYALRKGLSCLDDPANRERLSRCDAGAMQTIAEQLLNMHALSKGVRPNWPENDVKKLLLKWREVRGSR